MRMQFQFKEVHSFEQRKAEASKIRTQHPERIPIIVERATNAEVGNLDKNKFLVPNDITMSQLMYIVRKRIKLAEEKALFLSVNNFIPSTSTTVEQVYKEHCDEDGFLYVAYRSENTFGH